MGAPTRTRWMRRKNMPGFVAVGILGGLVLAVLLGLSAGAFIATGQAMAAPEVIQGFIKHRLEFDGIYWACMGAAALVLMAVFVFGRRWWKKAMPGPSWVDVAAQHMATPKEAASLSRKAVEKKARELGVKGARK